MSGSSQQTSQSINPQLLGLLQQNYSHAQQVASTPYQAYSGSSPTTANMGGGLLSNASGMATSAGNYNPSTVTAGQLSNTNLQPYENPYQKNVINSTMAQLGQSQNQALTATNQNATSSGAFGGSRSGVADALTNQASGMTDASTLANLNSQNYSQAQNAALSDIQNRMGASEFNTNAGLTANQQKLSAAGLLNQTAGQTAQNQLGQSAFDYGLYQNQQQYPLQMQSLLNSSLGMFPMTGTSTTTSNPGLFGILQGIF